MFGLMGDVLMRTSVLRAIRLCAPTALIHCYVDAIGEEVLHLSCDPKRALVVLRRRNVSGILSALEKCSLLWRIRQEKYDVIFDFYNGPLSRKVLRLSSCRECFWIKDAKVVSNSKILLTSSAQILSNPSHLNELYFSMVATWRSLPEPVSPLPWIDHKSADVIREPKGMDTYFVSISSGDPRKNLPIELVTRVATLVYAKFGWIPSIALNPGGERLQDTLCTSLREAGVPHRRLEASSLSSILEVMRVARFSLLPDTGLFHLALGAGSPVFGIFTYTNPCLVDPVVPWVRFIFKESNPPRLDQHGKSLGEASIDPKSVFAELERFFYQSAGGRLPG